MMPHRNGADGSTEVSLDTVRRLGASVSRTVAAENVPAEVASQLTAAFPNACDLSVQVVVGRQVYISIGGLCEEGSCNVWLLHEEQSLTGLAVKLGAIVSSKSPRFQDVTELGKDCGATMVTCVPIFCDLDGSRLERARLALSVGLAHLTPSAIVDTYLTCATGLCVGSLTLAYSKDEPQLLIRQTQNLMLLSLCMAPYLSYDTKPLLRDIANSLGFLEKGQVYDFIPGYGHVLAERTPPVSDDEDDDLDEQLGYDRDRDRYGAPVPEPQPNSDGSDDIVVEPSHSSNGVAAEQRPSRGVWIRWETDSYLDGFEDVELIEEQSEEDGGSGQSGFSSNSGSCRPEGWDSWWSWDRGGGDAPTLVTSWTHTPDETCAAAGESAGADADSSSIKAHGNSAVLEQAGSTATDAAQAQIDSRQHPVLLHFFNPVLETQFWSLINRLCCRLLPLYAHLMLVDMLYKSGVLSLRDAPLGSWWRSLLLLMVMTATQSVMAAGVLLLTSRGKAMATYTAIMVVTALVFGGCLGPRAASLSLDQHMIDDKRGLVSFLLHDLGMATLLGLPAVNVLPFRLAIVVQPAIFLAWLPQQYHVRNVLFAGASLGLTIAAHLLLFIAAVVVPCGLVYLRERWSRRVFTDALQRRASLIQQRQQFAAAAAQPTSSSIRPASPVAAGELSADASPSSHHTALIPAPQHGNAGPDARAAATTGQSGGGSGGRKLSKLSHRRHGSNSGDCHGGVATQAVPSADKSSSSASSLVVADVGNMAADPATSARATGA